MSGKLPDFDLSGFLPYRLAVAAQHVSAGLAGLYRNRFGISVAEWRVLVHLMDSGEVSVRELGQMVSLEKSKASRAATRLAEAGLIEKTENEADRRLVSLSLTDQGRALMAELLPLAIEFQNQLEARLAGHMAALNAALDRLMEEKP
ncbi:MarR family transcriptional regulator [Paracoccus sp. M683]|uniref:MarR family winged helix-turn-helix transcriptional regulator n=1 Tax=Paracoccus sp. M683 TaxID=2594268 RepID=UPI00117E10D4|nr:MarR family transcriptional regulator [Paracoccus sp. M683]TRW96811.1 MarR family transcriptional regulator [Paracoccus sp. M683]